MILSKYGTTATDGGMQKSFVLWSDNDEITDLIRALGRVVTSQPLSADDYRVLYSLHSGLSDEFPALYGEALGQAQKETALDKVIRERPEEFYGV